MDPHGYDLSANALSTACLAPTYDLLAQIPSGMHGAANLNFIRIRIRIRIY